MKSTVASAQLSRTSPMPLYHQVAGLMRVWIKDGKWQNGDIIPSYDHLKRQFGVARVTVRDAVKLLQVERLLSPKRGIGTVVIGKNNHQRLLKLGAGMSDLLKMYEGDTPELWMRLKMAVGSLSSRLFMVCRVTIRVSFKRMIT